MRIGTAAVLLGSCLVLPSAEGQHAQAATGRMVFLIPRARMAASITAPGTASLGSVEAGQSASVQMGQVRVTSSGVRTWTATVSASDFTTGGGTPAERIPRSAISYWSGPLVSKTGPGTWNPGQSTANDKKPLDVGRPAFSYNSAVMTSSSVVWQPRLVVSVPVTAVTGTYTGTVIHSVA
ncbi:hypothetical protein [Streptomyces sp. AC555_RSS877]|uniref:hypothetical protein n=1 Tax=Streptomyces sp. AC555_RSS877 TaxID=2823688 RepID=UPI001C2726BA|nr:hypothetical protein [Streptomyces sp. AC555_RSS877]